MLLLRERAEILACSPDTSITFYCSAQESASGCAMQLDCHMCRVCLCGCHMAFLHWLSVLLKLRQLAESSAVHNCDTRTACHELKALGGHQCVMLRCQSALLNPTLLPDSAHHPGDECYEAVSTNDQ